MAESLVFNDIKYLSVGRLLFLLLDHIKNKIKQISTPNFLCDYGVLVLYKNKK